MNKWWPQILYNLKHTYLQKICLAELQVLKFDRGRTLIDQHAIVPESFSDITFINTKQGLSKNEQKKNIKKDRARTQRNQTRQKLILQIKELLRIVRNKNTIEIFNIMKIIFKWIQNITFLNEIDIFDFTKSNYFICY